MWRRVASLVLGVLVAGSSASGQEWAKKMFEASSHDFGTVARGAKAEYRFVFSNLYMEDVHVSSARSSCGCTIVSVENPSLKTYEKGAIVASLNSAAFLGSRGATITVTIDRPFYAEIQLHVKALIRSDVMVDPGSVQLGEVDQGTAAVKKVTVSYSGRPDWKIMDVRGTNRNLAVDLVELGRQGSNVWYELAINLSADAPPGYVNDHIMLVTNDAQSGQIPVLVEGRVQPAITVSPASLFMGVLQPGQETTKQLVVKGKKPFRILSVTCEDKSFKVTAPTDPTPKTLHLIPVTFVAGENSGKVNKTIRIETDLGKTAPELAAYAVVAKP